MILNLPVQAWRLFQARQTFHHALWIHFFLGLFLHEHFWFCWIWSFNGVQSKVKAGFCKSIIYSLMCIFIDNKSVKEERKREQQCGVLLMKLWLESSRETVGPFYSDGSKVARVTKHLTAQILKIDFRTWNRKMTKKNRLECKIENYFGVFDHFSRDWNGENDFKSAQ